MILCIPNCEDFLNSFITPLSRIADCAVIKIDNDKATSIISNNDNSLVVYAEYNNIQADVQKNLNIPDLKKLCRILSCIESNNCNLDISNNNISYTSSDVRFKYHLYEDNIIKTPKQISLEKLKQITFDGKFTISFTSLNSLIKGSTIATDTDKIYLSFDGNNVTGELTDKSRANTDSYGIKISSDYTGEQIGISIPLKFELFRILSFMKFKLVSIELAAKRGLLIIDANTETTNIKFIASALQN